MEPHSRPSGSVAQLPIRVGFGFGSPSPVTGLTSAVAIAAGGSDSAAHAASIAVLTSTDIRNRNDDINPSQANLDFAAALPRVSALMKKRVGNFLYAPTFRYLPTLYLT